MTVFNPFKKKPVALTFNANSLEGFVDFGEFGGVFHKGLPNGVVTFWTVKDTCYEWMPGESVCYSDRVTKKQWGTYKMGEFQGVMECADGTKGGKDLICPDLDSAAVKKLALNADIAVKEKERAKAAEAMKDAEEDLARADSAVAVKAAADSAAKAKDSTATASAAPAQTDDEITRAIERGKKALAAKIEAQKALAEAEKALAEAKKAEREAVKAEQAALRAERQAKKAEKRRQAQEKKAKKNKKKK